MGNDPIPYIKMTKDLGAEGCRLKINLCLYLLLLTTCATLSHSLNQHNLTHKVGIPSPLFQKATITTKLKIKIQSSIDFRLQKFCNLKNHSINTLSMSQSKAHSRYDTQDWLHFTF
jgi:hypothetical protein